MHDDRRQPRPARIREAEARGVDRECIRQRRAIEHRQRGSVVAAGVHDARRPKGPVPLPREHLHASAVDFHVDRAELAVELGVLRRVGEQIMELVVLVDAPERGLQIVRLFDEKPAGVVGQPREARP